MNKLSSKQCGNANVIIILFLLFSAFIIFDGDDKSTAEQLEEKLSLPHKLSEDNLAFIKSQEQIDLEGVIILSKYLFEFESKNAKVSVKGYYQFSTDNNLLIKHLVVNDTFKAIGEANYKIVGSTLKYSNIKGHLGLFPSSETISIGKGGIVLTNRNSSKNIEMPIMN